MKKNPKYRRAAPDTTQRLRRTMQAAFLALNVWIGIEFWRFVRFYEAGAGSVAPERPAGVDGWLPIASLMNLKIWIATGQVPAIHPAGMFLLISFMAICLLLRKTFCSWMCPVGTISEYLWEAGRRLFRRNLRLPRWLDVGLRGIKYLLLALFVYVVVSMSATDLQAFMDGPYGIVADVKMLNLFRFLSATSAVVLTGLVAGSLFVQNLWCRYLCPYGALMGLASLLSPVRIRRTPELCIDCAKCARACPSTLPVDQLITIRSAECTACLHCVAACPAEGALGLSTVGVRRRVPAWAVACGMLLIFLGTYVGARA
ncbi:MAG TPA: 4Fe-4S binding protein, partial [Bryobacteraceae bacterium]|nr:4Fe-4S binding protein [Bryobacteraceae bacterium]